MRSSERSSGPALPTAHLEHERLGKPTALAVFASDNLSSVAYATEEILKAGGAGRRRGGVRDAHAHHARDPGVLAILLFRYRQTIKAYPSAGGAYIVTKDNFGLLPAQVAGVALLTDYVLTVVGVGVRPASPPSLGVHRAAPVSRADRRSVFIAFIAWGNLRGVKESGRIFAVPTYFFILIDVRCCSASGSYRASTGNLHPRAAAPAGCRRRPPGDRRSSWPSSSSCTPSRRAVRR